jgi:hypothetical protein
MIKYLLLAILALAVIGEAFDVKSDENSWQLIVNKKEALSSVTNGGKRIYKLTRSVFLDTDLADSASIILEEN